MILNRRFKKVFINYYNKRVIGSSVDTVENLKGMSRKEIKILLDEYKQVDDNFYLSQRATKSYYEQNKKEGKKC